jgi:hypothetical protein
MKGANSNPAPVHIKQPDQPSHCIKVSCPASFDVGQRHGLDLAADGH